MKVETVLKILLVVLCAFMVFICYSCFSSLGSGGAYGKNVVNIKVEGSKVSFNVKCPECGHVDYGTFKKTVDEGETRSDTARCLECGELYPISVTRR